MKKRILIYAAAIIVATGCAQKNSKMSTLDTEIDHYTDTVRIYTDSAWALNERDIPNENMGMAICYEDSLAHKQTQTVIRKANYYRGLLRGLRKAREIQNGNK